MHESHVWGPQLETENQVLQNQARITTICQKCEWKEGVSFMFRASCAMAKSEELENEISLQQQFRNLTNHDQAPEHTAYFTPFINKSVSMILYK